MNTEKHHQILTYHEITARRFLIQWLEKEKKKIIPGLENSQWNIITHELSLAFILLHYYS